MKTDRPVWGLWSLPHPTHCSYPAPPPTPTSLGFTHSPIWALRWERRLTELRGGSWQGPRAEESLWPQPGLRGLGPHI